MDRREFFVGTSAFGLVGLGGTASAEVAIGSSTLTTLSDGHLELPAEIVFGSMPQAEVQPIREHFGIEAERVTPECNIALYQDGDRNVIFDVGSGPDFMPTAGRIAQSLESIAMTPDDITHVVFTHAHPDHIWGLLDEFDDPLFVGASYLMGRAEWDYWWNPGTVDQIGEARQAFAVGAKRRMQAIEDLVEFFDDGDEILPGISAIASHGHTPGHMSFEVRQGNEAAIIAGDAIGNHHVAFARPEWTSGLDQDPETAVGPRRMLLDRLASEQIQLVGFHLPGGGIGHVERADRGFRFIGG